MKKAKSLLSKWSDSRILEQDDASKESQKTERLEKQKKQLATVLKTLLEESQKKLEDYYQTDESLSDDEFLDAEKPYLATAVVYSVLDDHPEFSGTVEEVSKETTASKEEGVPTE
jgi:hypothetical protein